MGNPAPLEVRKPRFTFGRRTPVPRHWFAGRPLWTHVMNSFHIVVPQGERWLVRVMRGVAGQLEPRLAEQVRGFGGQEAQHALEHERFYDTLRNQGFPVDRLTQAARRLTQRWLWDRMPPRLRVATVAGIEHYTAIFGAFALRHELSAQAHPDVGRLLDWHAAEEVEHRSVAFDVFAAVDGRYGMRLLGFAAASLLLLTSFSLVTLRLLRHERELLRVRTLPDAAALMLGRQGLARLLPAALAYLRPSFHPDRDDDDALASAVLQQLAHG